MTAAGAVQWWHANDAVSAEGALPTKSYRGGPVHTTYSRNNMGQKCEGNCGLWVLTEIKKVYTGNLKKFVRAIWELPAK